MSGSFSVSGARHHPSGADQQVDVDLFCGGGCGIRQDCVRHLPKHKTGGWNRRLLDFLSHHVVVVIVVPL